MLGGADNPNGELPSYITGANMPEHSKCEWFDYAGYLHIVSKSPPLHVKGR